jgi:hypothetical protein
MTEYTNTRVTPELEKEIDRLAELIGTAKSNIPTMCINIVLTYFTDKQILMEAPIHLPKDGRRKG